MGKKSFGELASSKMAMGELDVYDRYDESYCDSRAYLKGSVGAKYAARYNAAFALIFSRPTCPSISPTTD
jgi:hypothetical protein